MKSLASRFSKNFSSPKSKLNLFYFLAFAPLLLIAYYDIWILIVSFYGFVLFLLKSEKLQPAKEARTPQKIIGLAFIIGSFFLYYVLVLAFPKAAYYGGANYIAFLLGLFLTFFDLSGLKEAFSPIFFVAAATSSSLIAEQLEPYFSPYIDEMAYLIVNILRTLGINAYIYNSSNAPIISFTSLSGNLVLASFVYECIGVFSVIVFSILLATVLFEDPSSWTTRSLAVAMGILGTFAMNIIRVTIIFLTDYFYGAEAGATVHYIIGYALFSTWLVFFLYVYSKRDTVQTNIKSFLNRQNYQEA